MCSSDCGPIHGPAKRCKGASTCRSECRRADSEVVDRRIADSTLFTGKEPAGAAKHWIQCRFVTDVLGFGFVSFGSEFELDYVFKEFFAEPVTFAPAVARVL